MRQEEGDIYPEAEAVIWAAEMHERENFRILGRNHLRGEDAVKTGVRKIGLTRGLHLSVETGQGPLCREISEIREACVIIPPEMI